jgi:hypothetical protein
MTAVTKTSPESVLDLIRRRFQSKAWEALRAKSVTVAEYDIRRCLAASSDPDRFKRAYELLESALGRWRESLVRVAEESFRELCNLAAAHPELIEADPIEWAHAQIKALIAEELNGKPSRGQWRAEEIEAEEVAADPSQRYIPIPDPVKPGRHLEFYMRVIEGSLYGDPPEDSAWRAPSWVRGLHPSLERWSDERMPVIDTNAILRCERSRFEDCAELILDDAVEKARIDLACQPLPEGHKRSRDKKPGSARRLEPKELTTKWREYVIFEAINMDLWGEKYCKYLDGKKAKPRWYPIKTYIQAYADKEYRRLISKERDRIRRLIEEKRWTPDLIRENRISSTDPVVKAVSRL